MIVFGLLPHYHTTTTCHYHTFFLSNTVYYNNVVVVVVIYDTCIDVSSFPESIIDSSLHVGYVPENYYHMDGTYIIKEKSVVIAKIQLLPQIFQNCTERTHYKCSPIKSTVDRFSGISSITNEVILIFPYVMAQKRVVVFSKIGGEISC